MPLSGDQIHSSHTGVSKLCAHKAFQLHDWTQRPDAARVILLALVRYTSVSGTLSKQESYLLFVCLEHKHQEFSSECVTAWHWTRSHSISTMLVQSSSNLADQAQVAHGFHLQADHLHQRVMRVQLREQQGQGQIRAQLPGPQLGRARHQPP